ncbi:hypothetical protein [Phaeacidiphilus oryzae]|uniref:hypothetical protein n=1 Tax=Phaeacidiphilus oryzae TaxID=348818 RepID=UPI000563AD23|nr:hypothetical protein [Phaeacidiphilus oryzae]
MTNPQLDAGAPVEDFTAETLRLLGEMRAPQRRSRLVQVGYALYAGLLLVASWGGLFALGLFQKASLGADYTVHRQAVLAALPAGLTALALGTLLLAARDALWRGPVVPPRATVDWLLAHPVERTPVVRPWFWVSCGLALLPGLLGTGALTVLLALTDRASALLTLGWCAAGGVCVPLLATAAALGVERFEGAARFVGRATPYVTGLVLLLAAQSGFAAAGDRLRPAELAEMWSGPWGWPALCALAPTTARHALPQLALLLLLLTTAAGLLLADRSVGRISITELRRRSRTAADVAASLRTTELRTARQTVDRATAVPRPPRLRLPAPRRAWAVIPWRDAVGLLRAPGRIGKAVAFAAPAMLLGLPATAARGFTSLVLTVIALVLGYLSVAQLAEPARVEADDTTRSGWSPYPYPALMLRHGLLPAAAGMLLAAILATALGAAPAAYLAVAVVPPLVAAALVNACRGPARQDLMLTTAQVPGGSAGPFLFAAWYAAGPGVAIVVLAGPLVTTLHAPTAAHLATTCVLAAATTAVLALWAKQRATKTA